MDNLLVWRPLLPHVLVTTDAPRTLTGVEKDTAWLLNHAASYLQNRGESAPPGRYSNAP